MDWLSFFIGVLVGWLIEWLIDLFFWRRRWRSAWQDAETLQARLDEARVEIRGLEAENRDLRIWRQQASETDLAAPEVALPSTKVDVDLEAPAVALRSTHVEAELTAAKEALPSVEPVEQEKLDKIEGIGPKIAKLLGDNGILTFAQLATVAPDRLRTILREAGPGFRMADPESWPEQARLAADGAWDELQALQDRLVSGRRTRP